MSADMGGRLHVLTVRGIPIYIHASWLAIYALITWTLAVGYFPGTLPDLPRAAYWVDGLIAALLLFVSVLLHELSHSIVAGAHGLSVRGITLHVFGGVSELEDEPPSPRGEFLIAVVGPITSFAIAAVLWGIRAGGLLGAGSARAVVSYLIVVNVAVGVFNLIPGFPLDGGRLLRAALWRWQGSLGRATYLASRVGVAFAFGLIAVGVLQIFGGSFLGGLWAILIGLFLRNSADTSYALSAVRDALSALHVRDIMARDVVTVPADATITELVDTFWAHHFTSFPVVDDGAVAGIASLQQVRDVLADRWRQARVREVMRPLDGELVIAPADSVFKALEKAAHNSIGRLAVIDAGRLVGYLSLKDITHVLALRGVPGAGRGGTPTAGEPMRRAA